MSSQKYLMGKLFFTKKYKFQIFLFVLFSVYSLFLSQSAFGANLNLTATWTLNTEPDIREYRLYRTDGTRTLLGTTPHPNSSYPFTVTVPNGSSGTLLFVVTAVDTMSNQSADSNPASYPYNLSTTTVTINATDNTATEAGTTTGTFTVSRTGSTSGALTVYYTVSGTATPGSDYNSLSGSVIISSGSSTANIIVTPINDTVVEGNETVIVTLSANASYSIGSPSSATVTITSDDVASSTVTINATDNTATEAGTTTGTFTVSRTGSTSGALTVYYSVSGTATPGSDYNSLSGSVTIAAGSSTGTITVTPINDTVVEGNETVIVTLSANAAYSVGSPNSATVTITSDDVAETVTPPTTPSLGSSGGFLRTYRASAGDSNLYTGTSYKFSTGGSSSNVGSGVEYQFSWGEGTYSSWGSPSRGSCSQSHTWAATGTYQVRARARSKTNNNVVSDWSNALSLPIQGKPFIQITSPNGGENFVVGTTHTITWNRSYLSDGMIYLFYYYDGVWHPITTLSPTATSFSWTIPRIPEKVTSPAPSSNTRGFGRSSQSISIWIGNWVNGNWECYDKSDQSFRILYDAWVCKISGADQGGATLMFDGDSFEGFGISLKWGMFDIEGTYSMNAQGSMSGTYTIRDFTNGSGLGSGSFTGSIDSSSKKLTLSLTNSGGTITVSGVRFVSNPAIPGNWTGTLSGSASGSITSLEIDPYELDEIYSYVFGFSGSGSITGGGSININGNFYLTSATTSRTNPTNVYGIYTMTGAISEIGVLTGALNPSTGTISFTMTSLNGHSYTLKGNKTNTVELVSNGGMESGNPPTGWSVSGSPDIFERSGTQKNNGTYSAHIVETSATYSGFEQRHSETAGKQYKLSYWYYLASGRLLVSMMDGTNGVIMHNTHTTNGSWQYSETIYTQTKTGSLAGIIFRSDGVSAEFYIDDVSVQEVP